MTTSALQAIERLDDVTRLFEHAREHAQRDALALSAVLDQAMSILEDVAPAIAAARGGRHEVAVLRAAVRAKQSHTDLTRAIEFEVARLAEELARLNVGSNATAGYMPTADTGQLRRLDRVG